MLIDLLKDEKTPAIALLAIAMAKYDKREEDNQEMYEFFRWAPEILRDAMKKDFGCMLTDLQIDKLSTAIQIYGFDDYEKNLQVFVVASHLLNNHYITFGDGWEDLEAEQAVSAISEATTIKDRKLVFSEDILVYLGHVFFEYGFHNAPELFSDVKDNQFGKIEGSDTEKNEALKEIYDAKMELIKNSLKEVTKSIKAD